MYEWSYEAEKRNITCAIETYEVTDCFNGTESKLVRKMLQDEGKVFIGVIEDAAGILSCMQSEDTVAQDKYEIIARLLSNMNEAKGLSRYLIDKTELKCNKIEWQEYQTFLSENEFDGAGKGENYFVTGENDNIGRGIRRIEMKKALNIIGDNIKSSDLILISAGNNSRESLENIAYNMEKIATEGRCS